MEGWGRVVVRVFILTLEEGCGGKVYINYFIKEFLLYKKGCVGQIWCEFVGQIYTVIFFPLPCGQNNGGGTGF